MSDVSQVTTHVLDAAQGIPAREVPVTLTVQRQSDWITVADAVTDDDGRVTTLGPARLEPGIYRIVFDTGRYFAAKGRPAFYPDVTITFTLTDSEQHYHVPVLLSPFAYSTYRGS
ncbi:hydroxyisourate hydrolase [Rhodococcus opacus]|uniref:5-hydroxyisourate hydrolase n=1 Tax=Rhodococcus opacus TaxID=37919 RepID=A0A076F1H6_RHOOP|nr:hydroxyisourate hydrolase [Rhodococcus opacus]AII09579.1 5-hydroxyisourate hydrolase [Rhodococcus opacus]